MGKSRAEIQKAYRERKKAKEGHGYLRRETERVKRYYKPTTELGPHKLRKRRERIRKCMQQLRQKLKQQAVAERRSEEVERAVHDVPHASIDDQLGGPCDSTSSTSAIREPVSAETKFVVDMKFPSRRGQWKKSQPLKKAQVTIKRLEMRVNELRKRNNSLRKKVLRNNIKRPGSCSIASALNKRRENSGFKEGGRNRSIVDANLTPKSKSIHELRSLGISPDKHNRLVKKLTFHNSLVEEIKSKIVPNRGRARQRTALELISGKLIRKYRLRSNSSRALGVNRGQLLKADKGKSIVKRRKVLERTQMAMQVRDFLDRDDNSSCLPGKRDSTKTKTETKQTRVLNDYLYNLHLKFKAENPGVKTSLTTFSSYRPRYVKLVQYSARKTCLCQKHQNIALKIKGLKTIGVITTENPDQMIKQYSDEEIVGKIQNCSAETIKFSQWKRKEVEHKGRLTKRMLITQEDMPKHEFLGNFKKELIEFRNHTSRVKSQFEQIQRLKEKLPPTHAICQMDFAENYSCGHADEIQTAYFDKCSVTLHPVVLYMRNLEYQLVHESFIYVSDTQSHNTGTVYAFMKKITERLKHEHPRIECVHYITDSPTSQYRNKNTMYLVANHFQLLGMNASWQFWEAGHGKGPCDGVGGSSKRLADLAVKRQTAVIQSAEDYFNWGKSLTNSQTKYVFVPKEECDKAYNELLAINVKPIKGTLEVHSVFPAGNNEVFVKQTSCFCEECFSNGEFMAKCEGWIKHKIVSQSDLSNENEIQIEIQDETEIIDELPGSVEPMASFAENDFVAAVYNNYWYIGKIVKYDPSDDELPFNVSFMEHGKGKICPTFKWPSKDDSIWISAKDILCSVDTPTPFGSRKMYKLGESDISAVMEKFENIKKRK